MTLQEFSEQFEQEINDDLQHFRGSAEEAFVDRMRIYLEEYGVVGNIQVSQWQKTSQGIKVSAYSYQEDHNVMNLFVADYEMANDKMPTINRTEIEKNIKRVIKFFDQCASGKLTDYIEESNGDVYDLASLIEKSSGDMGLNVYLITNCVYKSNDLIELDLDREVNIQVWDIERLYQLINEQQQASSLIINLDDFNQPVQLLKVPGQLEDAPLDVYVGYVSGLMLAEMYEKYGQQLIERNVRSFLQAKGSVNKGIKETLQHKKSLFIAYNNGISTTAEGADLSLADGAASMYQLKSLTGWQIVNGGQTTASLHHAWKLGIDVSDVNVQIKLSVLKTSDEQLVNELIPNISRYANTQNKIQFSDLGANDSIHIQLEQCSRSTGAPDPSGRKSETAWYYERARGQYIVDYNRQPTKSLKDKFKKQYPKEMVVSKTQLSKYYMAWEQYPHTVSKGSEANFSEFMNHLKKNSIAINTDFYKDAIARAIIFMATDRIVGEMNLPGYKANVVAYTIAMLSYSSASKLSLARIWSNQKISSEDEYLIRKIAEITWNFISNPTAQGTNISQWCKKEDCWTEFRYHCAEQAANITDGIREVSTDRAAEEPESYEVDSELTRLMTILEQEGLEVVNQLPDQGYLWVVDHVQHRDVIQRLVKEGYGFYYSPNGKEATDNRAGWFYKG